MFFVPVEPWLFYALIAAKNRRLLQGPGTERIFRLGENVGGFANRVAEERLCKILLSEGVSKEKMCRKRFAGFDRYFQAQLYSSGKATQSGRHP